MKKSRRVRCLLFSLIFVCITVVVVVIYHQSANQSDEKARILKYFNFNVPKEAKLIVSEESEGFGDGCYLYIYTVTEDVMEKMISNHTFSNWSALPFTKDLSTALKSKYDGRTIGDKLKEYGLYTSKDGYYRFSNLEGKKIDFLFIQEMIQTSIVAQSNRDYTFCIFDIEHNLILFFIDIY